VQLGERRAEYFAALVADWRQGARLQGLARRLLRRVWVVLRCISWILGLHVYWRYNQAARHHLRGRPGRSPRHLALELRAALELGMLTTWLTVACSLAAFRGLPRVRLRLALAQGLADTLSSSSRRTWSRSTPTASSFMLAPILTYLPSLLSWSCCPSAWRLIGGHFVYYQLANLNVGLAADHRRLLVLPRGGDHRRLTPATTSSPSSARCARRRSC